MRIKAKIKCISCQGNPKWPTEWEGEIEDYQLGLLAIWFHSMHEGHGFDYWENDEIVLDASKVSR